jgi:HD-like signal output (HDOD) protein
MDYLAPIPVSVPRLAQTLADPSRSLTDLVEVIEYDPALTATSLRLANSAFYASAEPTVTVRDAVQRIGAGRILQFAVGRFVKERLSGSCSGYDLAEYELWYHSVAATVAVDLLPRYCTASIPPVAFTAALLHDIGKLILSRYLREDVKEQISELIVTQNIPYVDAELAILGCDHAQVGGVVTRRWTFPDALVECIQWHHHPRKHGVHSVALDAVHVGNAVAKTLGIGMGSEQMNMRVVAESAQNLGLTPQKLEALCAAVSDELPEIIELFEEKSGGL